MTEEVKIDCRYTCPSDVRKILHQYAKNRYWKPWEDEKHVVELEGDHLRP